MNECPFCNAAIMNRQKFYESEDFVALHDRNPFVKGHSLVLPKRHVEDLLKLNDSEKSGLMSFMNRAIFIALKYSGTYEFDVILQEGKNAGQTIPHIHFHILPRKLNDLGGDLSKKELLTRFAQHESGSDRRLTSDEFDIITADMRAIADGHKVQLETL